MYDADLAYIHDSGFDDFAKGAAPELIRILRSRGIRPAQRRRASGSGSATRIVEVGCGSGILARLLVNAGYDVFGIDQSEAMIRLARRQAPRARFHVGSLTRAAIPSCQAVIAMGEVTSYVRTGLGPFFRRVYAGLEPGGLFIFDFIESAKSRTYRNKIKGGADWAIVASAAVDPSGRLLTRRLTMLRAVEKTVHCSSETHRVRIRSRKDIARGLRAAGFSVQMRRSYGRYRLMAGDVAVIAVKRRA